VTLTSLSVILEENSDSFTEGTPSIMRTETAFQLQARCSCKSKLRGFDRVIGVKAICMAFGGQRNACQLAPHLKSMA